VICPRSQKIDEDLGRAILKCGGSVFVSSFDTRIALQTVLHEFCKTGRPIGERMTIQAETGWPSNFLSPVKKFENSEIQIVALASLLLRRDHIKPDREKCEMFDDLYRAQNNATCEAKCNELLKIENPNMFEQSKTCLLRKYLLSHHPEIEIEIPRLPESDLDLDPLAILGDPIRRAFLPPPFVDAVASRISDLPMSTRRLQQIFEEADAPIKLELVRFHTRNTPEIRARAREFKITENCDCGYKRIAPSIAGHRASPLSSN
jgi:hypothetical protein